MKGRRQTSQGYYSLSTQTLSGEEDADGSGLVAALCVVRVRSSARETMEGARGRAANGVGQHVATAAEGWRQNRSRRQTGWRSPPASTVIIFLAAVVLAAIGGTDAHASESEARSSSREQIRPRRATTTDDRRPRATTAVTDTNWAGVAPPIWLWRHLDTVPRRLDAAEGRLARIEALIELRLDQMVEGERSRNAKEDLWRDQESRRIELSFDRLERRLAYMETRLADAATADRVATASVTPRLQEQLRCQQEKLEESVEGVRKALVEVVPSAVAAAIAEKIKGPDLVPTPPLNINSHPPSPSPLKNCPSIEDHIKNLTKHASDALEHLKQKLSEEFGLQAEKFVSKVGNMYNDLWQRAQSIETLLKDALALGNSTQRDLHDGFRALVQQQQEQLQKLQQHNSQGPRERHGHSIPNRRQGGASMHGPHSSQNRDSGKGDWSTGEALELGLGSLELSVDTLSGTVARRLGELGRRLDSSFRMLLLAQNLFLESCHRIQLGEPTLEARLSIVLERLLDTVSNRSQGLNHEASEIKEALHSQTKQIATMMEDLGSGLTATIREGNEWLSTETAGENQRTRDEVMSLVRNLNGFGEETKSELCSLLHENTNETTIGALDGDQVKEDAWSKIPGDISNHDFEFHHVSAVVKDVDTNENISVIASLQKKKPDKTSTEGLISTKVDSEIHINRNPLSGPASLNDVNEPKAATEVPRKPANQSKVNETSPKVQEISTDPGEFLFDLDIPSPDENPYDLHHRVERKRSSENGTDSEVSLTDTKAKGGDNDTKQIQDMIGALTDQSLFGSKNMSDVSDIKASNSTVEEMKLILKDIILQIANEKNNIRDIKFNKTLDSALDDANLSHFIKSVFKIYKSQNIDLNLENLKTKISKEMNVSEELENLPESSANENILQFNREQDFNSTEAYIASYVKKIINLASKLDTNPSDANS
ncbi:uncharacterized protein LOC124160536 isoform X2 [Ischnura elegans]|uniref:uncharacterized protein LOC124160536 isoform X2 n=1 Tax=Ischnura elegans TaxID=197161 RepID=UPI001ED8AB56|nr:uncharacterized protein LOC124160536 isoform X2 [Ischnura elegans]